MLPHALTCLAAEAPCELSQQHGRRDRRHGSAMAAPDLDKHHKCRHGVARPPAVPQTRQGGMRFSGLLLAASCVLREVSLAWLQDLGLGQWCVGLLGCGAERIKEGLVCDLTFLEKIHQGNNDFLGHDLAAPKPRDHLLIATMRPKEKRACEKERHGALP